MADSASSSSLSEKSEADREETLDRLLTRLALCDDSNLQSLLSKLLPYTISSLSFPLQSIRKKVLEILSHVNKRVKHQLDIRLPLPDLWGMYVEPNAVPMVKNFCIVYIEMAFERLTVEEKADMAPELVANVSKLPPLHQDIVLRIVAKVISECHSSRIDEEAAARYRLIDNAKDIKLFVEFCLHSILYQPPPQGMGCPAGLSVAQSDRVTGKLPLKGDLLIRRKLGMLNVIGAMELAPELVYPLYMAACSDSQEPVIKKGEELLKRKAAGADLENQDLINRLFLLFNGTTGVENVAADSRVSPGNPGLRTRLMSVFCRSTTAANAFPSTLQCIFGCIYGSGSTSRLKQLGMEFTVWVFKHVRVGLYVGVWHLYGFYESASSVCKTCHDVLHKLLPVFFRYDLDNVFEFLKISIKARLGMHF